MREGIETGICLALMAKEISSDSSSVDITLEVKNLLDDFVDMVLDELLLRLFRMLKLFPSVGTKVVKHYSIVEVHRSSPQGVVS